MDEIIITDAQYLLNSMNNEITGIRAVMGGVDVLVPLDPGNRHYAAIMQAVADGELTIQEASE